MQLMLQYIFKNTTHLRVLKFNGWVAPETFINVKLFIFVFSLLFFYGAAQEYVVYSKARSINCFIRKYYFLAFN